MPRTYSPREASEALAIPQSTIRRYIQQFKKYLSSEAISRHNRRFTEDDLAIFARIRDLTNQGKRLEDIESMLGEGVPRLETAMDFPGIQKRMDDIYTLFQDQQQDLNNLKGEIDRIKQDIETERKRGLFGRLFGRK